MFRRFRRKHAQGEESEGEKRMPGGALTWPAPKVYIGMRTDVCKLCNTASGKSYQSDIRGFR